MNNKGQTLVFFIILIPLFVMLLAFIVDTGFIIIENTKLNSTTKTIIRSVYDERFDSAINDKISKLYQKNDIDTSKLQIRVSDNKIAIKNDYEIDSIFGTIIGLKKYEIKINMIGEKQEDKFIFNKD